MALTHVFDRPVHMDGVMGPQTRAAAGQLLVERGLTDDFDTSDRDEVDKRLREHWFTLLDETAQQGFGVVHDARSRA